MKKGVITSLSLLGDRGKTNTLQVMLLLWIMCLLDANVASPGCAHNPESGFRIKKSKMNVSGSQDLGFCCGAIFL